MTLAQVQIVLRQKSERTKDILDRLLLRLESPEIVWADDEQRTGHVVVDADDPFGYVADAVMAVAPDDGADHILVTDPRT
jgi:hypothetical protein